MRGGRAFAATRDRGLGCASCVVLESNHDQPRVHLYVAIRVPAPQDVLSRSHSPITRNWNDMTGSARAGLIGRADTVLPQGPKLVCNHDCLDLRASGEPACGSIATEANVWKRRR